MSVFYVCSQNVALFGRGVDVLCALLLLLSMLA